MRCCETEKARLDRLLSASKVGFQQHRAPSGLVSQLELHLSGPLADFSEPHAYGDLSYTSIIDIDGQRRKIPCFREPLSIKTKAEAIEAALVHSETVQGERLAHFGDEELMVIVRLAKTDQRYPLYTIPAIIADVLKKLKITNDANRLEFITQRKVDYQTYEKFEDWTSIIIQTAHGSRRLIEEHTQELINWGRKPYALIG